VFAVFQHLGRNNGGFKSCHNCSGFVLDKFFLPKVAQTVFFLSKNYGSRSKKGEIPRFELSHNALNRKPQK